MIDPSFVCIPLSTVSKQTNKIGTGIKGDDENDKCVEN